MSETMFLTQEELTDLTHKIRPAAQASVLNCMGIIHKMRPDGSVADNAHQGGQKL